MRTTARPAWLPAGSVAAVIGGVIALVLLGIQLPADPAVGVTFSQSPFTDEGWSVLGARNQALLGRWATDEWQLFWAQLPFNVVVAGVFELFGVGIVQARAVSVVCSVIAVAVTAALVARRLGEPAGVVTGIAMATSALFLYYGRLALLEPMVVLFLVVGTATFLRRSTGRPTLIGILAGGAFALAIGTKPTAALAVAGIIGGALLAARPWANGLGRRSLAAAATIAVLGIGWALVVLPQPDLLASILRIWPDQSLPTERWLAVRRVLGYAIRTDGALALLAPLLVGSVVGVSLVAIRWRSLDRDRRALAGASIGWIVVAMGVFVLFSYRPSRYVVPVVPPMAILTGFAGWLVVADLRHRVAPDRHRVLAPLLTAILCIAVAAPGVRDLAAWLQRASYRLPAIQAEVHRTVTDGRAVQGAAPLLAMRVPVPTIVAFSDVNARDLYESHDVRWLLIDRGTLPTWAERHAEAWNAREVVACYPWPSGDACLIRLP